MAGDPASPGADRSEEDRSDVEDREDREDWEGREDWEDKVEAARRLLREAISRPPPVPVSIRSTSRPGPAGTGS